MVAKPVENKVVRDPEVKAITDALSAPFDPKDVKFKPQMVKNNRCLAMAYIDARLIQDRLDDVLGVENWEDAYRILPDGSVMCRLKIKLGDRWISKTDVGSPSEQPDGGDRLKAAFSDALKRAAVKFGIGRYLYRLPAQWVDYDPVKKQIVRSGAQKPQPKPDAKAADRCAEAIRNAKSRDELTAVFRQFEADRDAGAFTEGEKVGLLAAFQAAGAKFPKPAKA